MRKLIILLSLSTAVMCGCREKKQIAMDKPVEPRIDVIYLDSPSIVTKSYLPPAIDSTVKSLLLEYYKAGWMDGSNSVIDMHNANNGNLSHNQIERKKKQDWRKMENQVNSK